jgi:hypothetical protein
MVVPSFVKSEFCIRCNCFNVAVADWHNDRNYENESYYVRSIDILRNDPYVSVKPKSNTEVKVKAGMSLKHDAFLVFERIFKSKITERLIECVRIRLHQWEK